MSRYKNFADAQKAHILTLRIIVIGLIAICLYFGYGWSKAPEKLTVHVPPDLRAGSTRLWWDIPPENIYSFALYLFTQINRWPTNGETDYKKNINAYQAYLTSSCKAILEDDFQKRSYAGELRNRVRGVYEILGRSYAEDPTLRVKQLDKNTWRVNLDLNADEYYMSEPVKRAVARYPLRVLRFDADPEHNPFGLVLDCFDSTPQKLEIPEGK
ncbi:MULTISPECIES: PFL_4703 family integrating conjugative element protein [Entomomonas]|uniref:TIGR03746 family integrating conjugative element protein n=1 Tax=Entomomonas asaccharolytica TaxID=2785331 RepID=A0A974NHC6_9GAMM|nr:MULTISPECIES: TIGR03746 family integrating conjugative element protein [Entomomonas]QQP86850.1 TIGR03746 family integrating conjugative element protein [Entomomonas asaccharolytica]UYZ83532.1 TIGR03746 family integrating conjugative element protein [Entomomonas sp. E2T0]